MPHNRQQQTVPHPNDFRSQYEYEAEVSRLFGQQAPALLQQYPYQQTAQQTPAFGQQNSYTPQPPQQPPRVPDPSFFRTERDYQIEIVNLFGPQQAQTILQQYPYYPVQQQPVYNSNANYGNSNNGMFTPNQNRANPLQGGTRSKASSNRFADKARKNPPIAQNQPMQAAPVSVNKDEAKPGSEYPPHLAFGKTVEVIESPIGFEYLVKGRDKHGPELKMAVIKSKQERLLDGPNLTERAGLHNSFLARYMERAAVEKDLDVVLTQSVAYNSVIGGKGMIDDDYCKLVHDSRDLLELAEAIKNKLAGKPIKKVFDLDEIDTEENVAPDMFYVKKFYNKVNEFLTKKVNSYLKHATADNTRHNSRFPVKISNFIEDIESIYNHFENEMTNNADREVVKLCMADIRNEVILGTTAIAGEGSFAGMLPKNEENPELTIPETAIIAYVNNQDLEDNLEDGFVSANEQFPGMGTLQITMLSNPVLYTLLDDLYMKQQISMGLHTIFLTTSSTMVVQKSRCNYYTIRKLQVI